MENWKNINGFSGYQVSDQGRVRSFRGDGVDTLRDKARVLNPQINKGYRQLPLYKSSTLKSAKTFKVAKLVANAFIPNPDNKPTINHINGIKTDDRAINLEWATYSENTKHAYDLGLNYVSEKQIKATSEANRGSGSALSKLTEDEVIEIRYVYENDPDITQKELGKRYGVGQDEVSRIVNRKIWTHI